MSEEITQTGGNMEFVRPIPKSSPDKKTTIIQPPKIEINEVFIKDGRYYQRIRTGGNENFDEFKDVTISKEQYEKLRKKSFWQRIKNFFRRFFGIRDNSVKYWRGRPLYRKNGRTYWKGTPIDDDEFEGYRQNPREMKQYNYWVRKLNRRNRGYK
jgi:hypothetical protein